MAFCSSCGAELPAGAGFCPKCGKAAGEGFAFDGMSGSEMKHARHEARRAEWSSPEFGLINAVFGGLTVILIGLALYLAASGLTPYVTWTNFWAYFLLGLGILLMMRGVLTFLIRMRRDSYGNVTGGVVLMVIGGGFIALTQGGLGQYFWIMAIVAVGLLIIFAGVVGYLFRGRWR
jgi:hypothetical protein